MGYFTRMADHAFKTSPTGERWFCLHGLGSRPYVIPDAATEQRLYKKHLWTLRVFWGGYLVDLFLPEILKPAHVSKWWVWWLIGFGALLALYWLGRKLLMASDLRDLRRPEKRLTPSVLYRLVAKKRGWTVLILTLVLSLGFLSGAIANLTTGTGTGLVLGIVGTVLFGFLAFVSGYTIYLKLTNSRRN
jgi:hypothetical protein